MMEGKCSSSILSRLDLYDIEEVLWEPYHKDGPGRPPRNPFGIFKALIVKRLRQIPSDRELYRRLWNDPALREVCDIEEEEKPYILHNSPGSEDELDRRDWKRSWTA